MSNTATEFEIREMIAESGKTKQREIMSYLRLHMNKEYDLKVAARNAKEMIREMKGYT